MPSTPEKNATNEQPLDTNYLYQETARDQADTDLVFYLEAFELNYLENYQNTNVIIIFKYPNMLW